MTNKGIMFRDNLNIPMNHFSNFEINENFVSLPISTKVDIFTNLVNKPNRVMTATDVRKWAKALTNDNIDISAYPVRFTAKDFIISIKKAGHNDIADRIAAVYGITI